MRFVTADDQSQLVGAHQGVRVDHRLISAKRRHGDKGLPRIIAGQRRVDLLGGGAAGQGVVAEQDGGGHALDIVPSLDENGAQIVEAMISGVETALAESPEGPALWMHWSWMPISGSGYVLGLSIEGYDAEEAPEATISEEDQQKVEQAVNDAFGANLDWESIQAGMDDGGGSGESSEFLTDSAEELLP